MIKLSRFAFASIILLAGFGFLNAQNADDKFKVTEFDYRVAIKQRGPIMVDSAFMEKVKADSDRHPNETFQLSFLIPSNLENLLEKTTLKLTAYDQKGNCFGMRVWHKVPRGEAISNAKGIPIVLNVNPEFANASRFSLEAGILEIEAHSGEILTSSATCPGCVDLAVQTCGEGRVESVKCGTTKDGSTCEFKCKP